MVFGGLQTYPATTASSVLMHPFSILVLSQ
jgi:hypothetical protein